MAEIKLPTIDPNAEWMQDSEALTSEDNSTYTSINNDDSPLRKLYRKQEEMVWSDKEFPITSDDKAHAIPLFKSPKEDATVKRVLSFMLLFFLVGDGEVNANMLFGMLQRITRRDYTDNLYFQMMMENVHNLTYSLVAEVMFPELIKIVKDIKNNISKIPASVFKKMQWAEKWIGRHFGSAFVTQEGIKNLPVQFYLIVGTMIESILFPNSFMFITWLRTQVGDKLPLLFATNTVISRDEALHRDIAIQAYSLIEQNRRIPTPIFHEMLKEAVEIECEFLDEAFEGKSFRDFNLDQAKEYSRYLADLLCRDMGYPLLYTAPSPPLWIALLIVRTENNFFEKPNTSYIKAISRSVSGGSNGSAPSKKRAITPLGSHKPMEKPPNIQFDIAVRRF